MSTEPTQQSSAEADSRLLAIAKTSADGILVVDADGRVCVANPVAEALLHREAHDLMGQFFGLPIMLGDVAEISLLHLGGEPLPAEMRSAAISWRGEPAHLIVLRDLTEQRRTQEALSDAEGFSRAILNSLSHHIAVLDESGTIVLINDAWRQFALENGDPLLRRSGVGANYFAVCAAADGVDSAEAPEALAGMRRVLHRDQLSFELEYPCHSPDTERWYHMRVVPLLGRRPGLVISHTNITEQRKTARLAAEAEALRAQLEARERELRSLGAISGGGRPHPEAAPQQMEPEPALRVARPEQFDACVRLYSQQLAVAVAARGFEVSDGEAAARQLAARLGAQHATARDVIDIYLAALRGLSAGVALSKQQAYLEESRVLALQVMGYLVSYYRNSRSRHPGGS